MVTIQIILLILVIYLSFAFSEKCEHPDCLTEKEQNVWIEHDHNECISEHHGWDSFVCSCSTSHCDYPGQISHPVDPSKFTVIMSSRDKHRFLVEENVITSDKPDGSIFITLNPSITYQDMIGYGGAFTDAAGIVFSELSPDLQDAFLKSYFSSEGLGYSAGRLPIGGTDFSTRPYAYNEVDGDLELENFALEKEDWEYKIPLVKRALKLNNEIKLIASPWSPPKWMKTNGKIHAAGEVKTELRQVYANYLVKFIDEYENQGIKLFGMTAQNEPLCGTIDANWPFNSCLWYAEDMRDWISGNLGPALISRGYENLKLIINDQIRNFSYDYTSKILENQKNDQFVSGISFHWYGDSDDNVDVLVKTASAFSDKFMLYTEACTGSDTNEHVKLGDWSRAEQYAKSLIETANNRISGWIDWNLALDMQGGPNWAENYVDSPIIVDSANNRFYKQPMFYALGHFSKFVDGRAIYHSVPENSDIKIATFMKEDNKGIAVLLNVNEKPLSISILLHTNSDKRINIIVPAKSIQTLLFTFP